MSGFDYIIHHRQYQDACTLHDSTAHTLHALNDDMRRVLRSYTLPFKLLEVLNGAVLHDYEMLDEAYDAMHGEYKSGNPSMHEVFMVFECVMHSIQQQLAPIHTIIHIDDAFALKFTDDSESVLPAGAGWEQLKCALGELIKSTTDAHDNIADFAHMHNIGKLAAVIIDKCEMRLSTIKAYYTTLTNDMQAFNNNIHLLYEYKLHTLNTSRAFRDKLARPLLHDMIRAHGNVLMSSGFFYNTARDVISKHRREILLDAGQAKYRVSDVVNEHVYKKLASTPTPSHVIKRLVVAAMDVYDAETREQQYIRRTHYSAAIASVVGELDRLLDAMSDAVCDSIGDDSEEVQSLKSTYTTTIRHVLCTPLLHKYVKHAFNRMEYDAYYYAGASGFGEALHRISTTILTRLHGIISYITRTSIDTLKAHNTRTDEQCIAIISSSILEYINKYLTT